MAVSRPVAVRHARPTFPSPLAVFTTGWEHRHLILAFAGREIMRKYRGSLLGWLWSLFTPLLVLLVYTFVFTVIFAVRSDAGASSIAYPLLLLVGLIVFRVTAECLSRGPKLLIANAVYVRRTVFPIETLSWIMVVELSFDFAVSAALLLVLHLAFEGIPPWTVLLWPLVLLPLAIGLLSLLWFLSALGAYVRDVAIVMPTIMPLIMFGSPVFYPLDAVPEPYGDWMYLNPMTFYIEASRDLLLRGTIPDAGAWLGYSLLSLVAAWLALAFFRHTREGFADVL